MAAKHFMIYYNSYTGTYVVTEPRPWSRQNQKFFPNFTFKLKNEPTTNNIETWLIKKRKFVRVVDNDKVSLIQNVDPNLEL